MVRWRASEERVRKQGMVRTRKEIGIRVHVDNQGERRLARLESERGYTNQRVNGALGMRDINTNSEIEKFNPLTPCIKNPR